MARNSRKKQSAGSKVLRFFFYAALFGLLVFLLWISFGRDLLRPWLPSGETKDLNEWFEVRGEEVRLYLDDKMEEDLTGIYRYGKVYLPVEFVSEEISHRFFLNEDRSLSCTLPDRDSVFDSHSYEGSVPVLLTEEGEQFLLLDTVEQFADIVDVSFADDSYEARRVFLYTGVSEGLQAEVRKKTPVRTRMTRTAPSLDLLMKGDKVALLDSGAEWSKVSTAHGVIGYVPTDSLGETEAFRRESSFKMPKPEPQLLDKKVVLGWHGVYGKSGNDALESLYANTGGALNVVSPTWIQISGEDGAFVSYASAEYVEKAHAAGLQVWAAVDNFNQPEGLSSFKTGEYFADRGRRADFIARLMEEADAAGFDGINIDFEGIPSEAGPAYLQFLRELSLVCRQKGLVLSTDNYMPYAYNDHYDLGEQSYYVDYIVIMGYDEHTGSDAGSVSSLPWLEAGLQRTLELAPAEQVVEAVPFYTRAWTFLDGKVTSAAMGMSDADRYVSEQDIHLAWDESCGQFYGEVSRGRETVKIWMEDSTSLGLKAELCRRYELGGIAAWRLGYEPEEIWTLLDMNNQ